MWGGGFGGKTAKRESSGSLLECFIKRFLWLKQAMAEEQRQTSRNKYGANNMILSSVTFHQSSKFLTESEN